MFVKRQPNGLTPILVQQHPSGAMREHILQVCNTCLSEQAAKEKEEREKHTDHEVIYEKQGSAFIQTFKVLRESSVRMRHSDSTALTLLLPQRICV